MVLDQLKETTSRKRKPAADDEDTATISPPSKTPKKAAAKKEKSKIPDVTALDFDNECKSADGKPWNLKLASWNVNGIRAWLRDVVKHDIEGRVITAEYKNFYLVATYVPNAGRGLVRLDYRQEWDEHFRAYLKKLDEKKPVVLCGDLNVAHEEIDLANPKTNKKNAGFSKKKEKDFQRCFRRDLWIHSGICIQIQKVLTLSGPT
ncbi:DNA-(apurinic or apyrimidinic site) endonuclease [Caerostris extrusa]|uniref:exodeoxyribonuclease III n=1 Tax=Caerostris extrusa TaxID=172846 RepID=A0AAV4W442_CAEEX|nr:DNA-(apurinic or apyrimidinic site) endonuclease [Caerostris extrusa]